MSNLALPSSNKRELVDDAVQIPSTDFTSISCSSREQDGENGKETHAADVLDCVHEGTLVCTEAVRIGF